MMLGASKNVPILAFLLLFFQFSVTEEALAQFSYTTTNGTITITGYSGPGGNLVIPSDINGVPVSSIGAKAFMHLTNSASITIPTNVTSIGNFAFVYSTLTNVTIGSGVTNIGYDAFGSCFNLAAIIVDSANLEYSSGDGVLFNKRQDTLIQYPAGKAGEDYSIHTNVLSIGDSAFENCTNIANLTIPNTVTIISDNAFFGCSALKTLVIPNSVTFLGQQSFWECEELMSISISTNITSIWVNTFAGCSSLANVTIPEGVISVGDNAFGDCTSLTNITFPDSVKSIGNGSFSYCWNLTNVKIPKGVTSLGDSAFGYCSALTNLTIYGGLTTIGKTPFTGCLHLTSVNLADNATSIGDWALAFDSCTNLSAVMVDVLNPLYTSLDGVLFDISQISLIFYPPGKVGYSYYIPQSVTNISDYAFAYCMGLTNVNVPDSVTSIGVNVFGTCYNLNAITVDAANSVYGSLDGVLYNKNQTTLVAYPPDKLGDSYTIPPNVTSIMAYAFNNCHYLKRILLQGNAPSVDSNAFNGSKLIVYYLPGTIGWSSTFWGETTAQLEPLTIPVQPVNSTVLAGDTATFTATASGNEPLNYQWQFNGNTIGTNMTLTVSDSQLSNAGGYTLIISDFTGSVTSQVATLTVLPSAPRINSPQMAITMSEGQTADLGVSVFGTSPIYQWQFEGGTIIGATNNTLSITNIQSANSGNYSLTASNVYGQTNWSASLYVIIPDPYVWTTIAGLAGTSGKLDGVGSDARFNYPLGIAVDAKGNVYVADENNGLVRKISPLGTNWVVSTIAGNNRTNRVGTPYDITVDNLGSVYVTDGFNGGIHKVMLSYTNWVVSTVISNYLHFTMPDGIAIDTEGNLFVSDRDQSNIQKISLVGTNWSVTPVAGLAGHYGGTAEGTNTTARFWEPCKLAIDINNNIYVADTGNSAIRRITESGTNWVVSTIAGKNGYNLDGPNSAARFFTPEGVATDVTGNIYVADTEHNTIRKLIQVGTNWVVTTIGGLGYQNETIDGIGADAHFSHPTSLAVDSAGNIFVTDYGSHTIRRGTLLPKINGYVLSNETIQLTWTAFPGQSYQIQYKTNLEQDTWTNLEEVIRANGSTATTSDEHPADSQRFYRVMRLP